MSDSDPIQERIELLEKGLAELEHYFPIGLDVKLANPNTTPRLNKWLTTHPMSLFDFVRGAMEKQLADLRAGPTA